MDYIEYYNKNQSEYELLHIEKIGKHYDCLIKIRIDDIPFYDRAGFYEWLFNPKYKVFEVFGINLLTNSSNQIAFFDGYNYTDKNIKSYAESKTVPEILPPYGRLISLIQRCSFAPTCHRVASFLS